MLLHTWLPQTLRAAGIKVVETAGWTSRSHGQLPGTVKVVWHHDASPPGDSPGALNWMISNWSNSSAQIWVDNYGTWYMVGTGVAWHAGKVLPGMPDNFSSIGIETDQTTGEAWPPAQLNSLRKGTAAIFSKQNVPASSWLHFHKSICSPVGRKSDPYGLDLTPERNAVAAMMKGGSSVAPPASTTPPKPPTTPPKGDEDLPLNAEDKKWIQNAVRQEAIWVMARALNTLLDGKGNQAFGPGSTIALDNMGMWGRLQRGVDASRTGKGNAAYPNPAKPKD